MPTRTDVQTDVHIVPVDSDSPIRNLLKIQTVRCALVLYKGNYIPSPAPILNIKGPWTKIPVTVLKQCQLWDQPLVFMRPVTTDRPRPPKAMRHSKHQRHASAAVQQQTIS